MFQHTVAVAQALESRGVRARVHTATDHELADVDLDFCRCFDWHRDTARGRSLRILLGYFGRTVPHLLRTSGRTLWVQGGFKPPLFLALIVAARLTCRRVLFSPHNLFERGGRRLSQRALDLCTQAATCVVVYNGVDAETLRSAGRPCKQVELVMYAPTIDESTMTYWRKMTIERNLRVCAVGQLRPDKNLGMLVRAAEAAGVGLVLAGEDLGVVDSLREQIARSPRSNVLLHTGYLDLPGMAAIVASVGAVALPYSVASQSAVAVMAKSYGATVLASGAGGLAEQADVVVPDLEERSWAAALERLASAPRKEVPRTPVPPAPEVLDSLERLVLERR
ncbi:glycosyltransferase [Nocardioides rubriscoriae]|uniref:glycosyltransferase n=1 Tax=Nocardioides rubriscoriae TaxID=642762 RepID=UPI0011DF7215|nr:glycosyltransferase [Nocardioides rubriscoriae]